jgi:hypothetical protein
VGRPPDGVLHQTVSSIALLLTRTDTALCYTRCVKIISNWAPYVASNQREPGNKSTLVPVPRLSRACTSNDLEDESRFNKFDVSVYGFDGQIRHLAERHPRTKLPIFAVWGDDHEGWYAQREGMNVGKYAEGVMNDHGHDWTDLGFMEAHIRLVNANTGKASVMSVVHPGGGGFDDAADILTKGRGWIRFSDLTLEDEVATMSIDRRAFDWQRPMHISNEPYTGLMYRFTNRVFEASVTPDHRFMVKRKAIASNRWDNLVMPQKSHRRVPDGWHILTADEIAKGYTRQKYAFPTTVSAWEGTMRQEIAVPHRRPKRFASTEVQHFGSLAVDDAVELIGWYVTEGSASHKQFSISQYRAVNPDNHRDIEALLRRIGCRPHVSDRYIQVSSVELTEWLVGQCGKGSYHVHLPEWVKDLPRKKLQLLLSIMIRADGWRNGRSFGYRTASARLMNDVCEIAQKAGFGVVTRVDEKGIWSVNLRVVQNEPTLNNPPEQYDYSGNIYCCTVPNGMIFVRVNGRCFWSPGFA